MFLFYKKSGLNLLIILIVFLTILNCASSSERTEINATFDHASLGPVRIIADTLIKGQTMHWIKKDKIGNQYYWFYFKLSNVAGKTITFELDNMTGVYRNNLQEKFNIHSQPVFSYDQEDWSRITSVDYFQEKKQFKFVHSFKQDDVWIAYAHPYPLTRHQAFINQLKMNPAVQIEKIGESVLGNDISLVTLPRGNKNAENPKTILLLACQHAGEDCGGYFVEGLIQELLTESEKVRKIREYTTFKIIPMMNPDGMFFGISRYNYRMEDLNAEWDDDVSDSLNLPVEPEVQAVKSWYRNFTQKDGLNLVVDVHSHGQEPRSCTLHSEDEKLSVLVKEINKYWPVSFVLKPSQGNCRGFFVNVEKIPACTLELSQSDLNNGAPYLTIDDYYEQGKQLIYAMNQFLINRGKEK